MHKIFYPKYSLKIKAASLGCLLFSIAGISILIKEPNPDTKLLLACLFFPLIGLIIPLSVYRRIEFGESICLVRWIFPNKIILYSEIKDIGLNTITTKAGNISINEIKNSSELLDLLDECLSSGEIKTDQIEGRLVGVEILSYEAGVISFPIYLAIHIPLIFLGWVPNMDGKLFGGAIFIGIYLITFQIMKRRQKSHGQSEETLDSK
ncbi:MAG: hypothetical protein JWO30_4466 [Fibrobacteres bacterium]|nr:hypothetical protein [Fibrobacterota bacterium]